MLGLTRLVIFDLDGVLLDSWRLMEQAFKVAWSYSGRSGPPPLERFRRSLGQPLEAIADQLQLGEDFVAVYRAYSTKHAEIVRMFPGVPLVLGGLHSQGLLLGLATGKDRPRTLALLDRFALKPLFASIVCGEDVRCGKPDPEPLRRIMEELHVDPAETVFVGDSILDIQCAVAAGATPVAVSWGFEDPRELALAGATTTLDSLDELVAAVVDTSSDDLYMPRGVNVLPN